MGDEEVTRTDLQHHSAFASSQQQTLKQESSRMSSQQEFPNNTQTVQELYLVIQCFWVNQWVEILKINFKNNNNNTHAWKWTTHL